MALAQDAQTFTKATEPGFSLDIYRRYNLDLQHLNDEQLAEHFRGNRHERRTYAATSSTAETLSMRWLRGEGIEIGAGRSPMPLYGNATVQKLDSDDSIVNSASAVDAIWDIDDAAFALRNRARFDFAVASHVLEHTDSFLRALDNLLLVTRPDGIVYIVLPDVGYLDDKNWMPNFGFEHHVAEYENSLAHADLHDRHYVEYHLSPRNDLIGVYRDMVASKKVPADMRFLYHKHNYAFNDWLSVFVKAQEFLAHRFRIMDARFGYERSDCHFVLQVT